MTARTRGRVTASAIEPETPLAIVYAGGIIAAVGSLGTPDAEDEANAAHLAACWNAFERFDDDTAARLIAWLDNHNNDELRQMLDEEGI